MHVASKSSSCALIPYAPNIRHINVPNEPRAMVT